MPWNVRIGGHVIPLTAVLGALGTFVAWVSVVVLHTEARTVGVGWMVVGLGGYFLYRRRQKLDPRREYRLPRRERPGGFVELAYRSALVPIFGTDADAQALRAAARLVGEGAEVEAVYVIRVPSQLSLDAGLGPEEQVAATCSSRRACAGGAPGSRCTPDSSALAPPGLRSSRRRGASAPR